MGNTVLKLSNYKMNCGEVENLSSDFIGRELNEPVNVALKKHASGCLSCSNLIEELSQINEWASNLGDLPLSEEVSSRLRDRLRAL